MFEKPKDAESSRFVNNVWKYVLISLMVLLGQNLQMEITIPGIMQLYLMLGWWLLMRGEMLRSDWNICDDMPMGPMGPRMPWQWCVFFFSSLEVADWRKNIQAMHWCRWISQHLATGWLLGECLHFTTPGATKKFPHLPSLAPNLWIQVAGFTVGAEQMQQAGNHFEKKRFEPCPQNADLNLRPKLQANMPCVSTCVAALVSFSGYAERLR